MKLILLAPQFIQHRVGIADSGHGRTLPDGSTQLGGFETDEFHDVDTLAEAHGISFLCPKCFVDRDGHTEGVHEVHVYFESSQVPDHLGRDSNDRAARWKIAGGDGPDNLTLTPSIWIKTGCGWHGFITNGEASFV